MTKGLWVKLSVDYLDDPKILAAGLEGEVLFVRGLAWAKKQGSAVIPFPVLARIGFGIDGVADRAATLVALGLWTETHEGFRITAWDSWQTDGWRAEAGSLGAHRRWHKSPVDGCAHCAKTAVKAAERPVEASEDVRRLCALLAELMVGNGCKPPTVGQAWVKDMDAILRLDKRPVGQVERVIRWCQSDTFWRSNILSPGKLRRQFDTLSLRMGLAAEAVPVPVATWVADPNCEMCGGDGLVPVGEDNTYGPCPCRRVA